MAIGGSITETTHAKVLNIPCISMPSIQLGTWIYRKRSLRISWILKRFVDKNSDGALAPAIVIQKTIHNNIIIDGRPVHLFVRKSSKFLCFCLFELFLCIHCFDIFSDSLVN